MKQKNILLIACLIVLSGCTDTNSLYDEHPEIEKGDKFVLANFLSPIDFQNIESVQVMLQVGQDCKMEATAFRYKKSSIRLKPKSISCLSPVIHKELSGKIISDAYIDTNLNNLSDQIRFELYVENWSKIN